MNIFFELLQSFLPSHTGYLFMWVLAVLGATAVVVSIERWIHLLKRTNVDGAALTQRLVKLIRENRHQEAYELCASGGRRALPRVLGAGIRRATNAAGLIRSSMEEEVLHMIPSMEKRLSLITTCGNIATLIGLMGTIYGLIIAFAAVAQPGIPGAQKTSLLAMGISAAMNTTLLGLIIAVPCVLIYTMLRERIDETIAEIDRYGVTILKALAPVEVVQKSYKLSAMRLREEIETEPNIVPFMNLMVVLIPLLLSSAEFIKLGMIELKLPEASQGEEAGGGGGEQKTARLNLGVVITSRGFSLFHYFKADSALVSMDNASKPEIPLVNNQYDYATLNVKLAEVKRRVLGEILRFTNIPADPAASLEDLYARYAEARLTTFEQFADHEELKIVAEDTIKYQVVVSVMDAARGWTPPQGNAVPLFPNVSIAGGVF